jgi:hypothetical protein
MRALLLLAVLAGCSEDKFVWSLDSVWWAKENCARIGGKFSWAPARSVLPPNGWTVSCRPYEVAR